MVKFKLAMSAPQTLDSVPYRLLETLSAYKGNGCGTSVRSLFERLLTLPVMTTQYPRLCLMCNLYQYSLAFFISMTAL
jgi:hypothetical protein